MLILLKEQKEQTIFCITFRHSPSLDASFHIDLENYNIKHKIYKMCRMTLGFLNNKKIRFFHTLLP